MGNKRYILYVRDKNSDNTMKFEYGSKKELVVYASALIEHGYAEVRAVIEEVKETEIEGVIAQLESLKDNSKSFADKDEPDSVWYRDIIALDYAIDTIKAYQDGNPSRQKENINQCNCNTVKKVRLVNNEDFRELIRFLEGVQVLVINDRQELAIEALEHKKKVLQDKIEEVM